MFEYAPQASNLANKGRYGDSMLVHMNPAEVGIMNAMSGDRMTVNPETGQPEAFAFLLPLLGGLAGGALGGAGLLGGLGALSAGALGTGIGKFAETGSLKKAILSGAMSYGIGSLAKGAMGAFADKAAEAGTAGFTPLAGVDPVSSMPNTVADAVAGGSSFALSPSVDPLIASQVSGIGSLNVGLPDIAKAVAPLGAGQTVGNTFVSDAAQNVLKEGFSKANPIYSKLIANPFEQALGETGATIGSAIAPGAQALAGSIGSEAIFPEYPDYDEPLSSYRDIPEADPPTRRLRRMPANFAQNNTGEFKFFEDPAKERVGESARNFFPRGSTAEREMKYGGRPMFAEAGGLMRSFDKDQIREDGGKLPGIAGALFGVGNPQKFFGMSPEQLMLLEKKKAKRMQEGGDVTLEEETVVTEEMPMGNDTRSDPEMEQDAMIFNAGVNAVMCESDNAAQDLQMFVERFGMDRLHQIICEVMEMAQGEEVEGELTKEDMPVAMQAGGSVDTIPASLEGKQSYLLAENEYIVPEPVVRAVGNGDPEMGAMAFDRFVDQVKATA